MAAEGYSRHPELGVNKNAYILPRFIAGKISENLIIAAIYRGKNHRKKTIIAAIYRGKNHRKV